MNMQVPDVTLAMGRKVSSHFEDALSHAKKRVWILSPWLSIKSAKSLVDRSNAGIDVKVFTTNDFTPGHRKAMRELLQSKKELISQGKTWAKWVGVALLITGIATAISMSPIMAVLIAAGIALWVALGRDRFKKYWNCKIGDENLVVFSYSPGRSVHAKVFLIDDLVVIGSPNFTDAGLERNLESISVIRSDELAEKMAGDVTGLEKSWRLKRKSIEEVGQALDRRK